MSHQPANRTSTITSQDVLRIENFVNELVDSLWDGTNDYEKLKEKKLYVRGISPAPPQNTLPMNQINFRRLLQLHENYNDLRKKCTPMSQVDVIKPILQIVADYQKHPEVYRKWESQRLAIAKHFEDKKQQQQDKFDKQTEETQIRTSDHKKKHAELVKSNMLPASIPGPTKAINPYII